MIVPEGVTVHTKGKIYKSGDECPDKFLKKISKENSDYVKLKSDYKKSEDDK